MVLTGYFNVLAGVLIDALAIKFYNLGISFTKSTILKVWQQLFNRLILFSLIKVKAGEYIFNTSQSDYWILYLNMLKYSKLGHFW